MLEARRPFPSDNDPRALLHRIVNEEPPALMREGIPHDLSEIIFEKLLAKDPAHRYQSMSDVEAGLSVFITQDIVRRRRTPLSIPVVDASVAERDLARRSDLIPRPTGARNTPWPNSDTMPVIKSVDPRLSADPTLQPIALTTPPPAKKPIVLYGIAGLGLLVGALGLALGMRGGSTNESDKVAMPAPPPAPTTAPAAATQPVANKIAVKIDANVPDARVTFRRRLSAAPATMEITSSDIVELVEVSAPGYKTTRYWLTFDRPTKLTAALTKGTGLVEATEEQTLVALGEVNAPVETKVAAAAPVVAAAPVAVAANPAAVTVKPATPAAVPAPRKIGKGTDEVAIEPTKIEQVEHPATEPEVAKPALPEQPAVVIDTPKEPEKVVVEPKPDPKDLMEPKGDVVPEAKPEPAKPAIDQATLAAVVGKNRPAVLKCFAEGKKANPKLKGTLTLTLGVDASGAVKRVQVQSTITGQPMLAACVVKAAHAWHFPARNDGQMANVAYPFVIN
jgi:hypothetical protein